MERRSLSLHPLPDIWSPETSFWLPRIRLPLPASGFPNPSSSSSSYRFNPSQPIPSHPPGSRNDGESKVPGAMACLCVGVGCLSNRVWGGTIIIISTLLGAYDCVALRCLASLPCVVALLLLLLRCVLVASLLLLRARLGAFAACHARGVACHARPGHARPTTSRRGEAEWGGVCYSIPT